MVATSRLLLLSTIVLLPLTELNIANALWTREVCTTFPKFGVTSLLKIPKSGKIISGTKGGKIFRSVSKDVAATSTSWIQLEGDEYNCKYPIYSLAEGRSVNHNDSILFCGGGDRYISVWEPQQPQGDDKTTKYSCSKRLGPHTGWVKSLAYSDKSQLLYSIGCNCIETWGWKNISSDINDLHHLSKRSIENSPDQGSTLSSDLLCLCLLDDQRLLLSGGVDGRIHAWSSDDVKAKDPIFSSRIHDGRINRIIFDQKTRLVFSVGNDGKLIGLSYEDDSLTIKAILNVKGLPRLTSVLNILDDDDDGSAATTTTTISRSGHCHHELALGTADGEVAFVDVIVSDDLREIVSIAETDRCTISSSGSESTMVYALENCLSHNGQRSILVGHGAGLTKLNYS